MKITSVVTFALAAVVSLSGSVTQASSVADPGFEDPALYTFDGPPFIGSWEAFSGSANASSVHSTVAPRNGTGHAEISILGDDNSFAGVFGAIEAFPGREVDASIWHATPDAAIGVASEFRIEFHGAMGEISRVTNDFIVPGAAYSQLSVSGIAPAGATEARMVYAIQTFGNEPDLGVSNSGTVYLDDASFSTIPEPTAAVLALLGLVPLARRRR